MKMIPKSSKFTPFDADTLETLAHRKNITVSELINIACGRMIKGEGLVWQGKDSAWGDAQRFSGFDKKT